MCVSERESVCVCVCVRAHVCVVTTYNKFVLFLVVYMARVQS